MENDYSGQDRREFLRLDYVTPLAYKVCREETIRKILEGYTSNLSESGALCRINNPVNKDDILWLSFDRSTLNIFEDIEKRTLKDLKWGLLKPGTKINKGAPLFPRIE